MRAASVDEQSMSLRVRMWVWVEKGVCELDFLILMTDSDETELDSG